MPVSRFAPSLALALLGACAGQPLSPLQTPPAPALREQPAACEQAGLRAIPVGGPMVSTTESDGWRAVGRSGWIQLRAPGGGERDLFPPGDLLQIAIWRGGLWVAMAERGLGRFDLESGALQTWASGGRVRDLAIVEGAEGAGRLVAADAAGRLLASDGGAPEVIPVDGAPSRVWAEGERIRARIAPGEVVEIAPDGTISAALGDAPPREAPEGVGEAQPTALAPLGEGAIAVGLASADAGVILVIDAESGAVAARYELPGFVRQLAPGAGGVWVAGLGLGWLDADGYRQVALPGEALLDARPSPEGVVALSPDRGLITLRGDAEAGLIPVGETGWGLPAQPATFAWTGGRPAVATSFQGRLVWGGEVIALPAPASGQRGRVALSRASAIDERLVLPLPAAGLAALGADGELQIVPSDPGAFDAAPWRGEVALARGPAGLAIWRGGAISAGCALPGDTTRLAASGGRLWALSGALLLDVTGAAIP